MSHAKSTPALRTLHTAILGWIAARTAEGTAAGEDHHTLAEALTRPFYLVHLGLDGARAVARAHAETPGRMAEHMVSNVNVAFSRLGLDDLDLPGDQHR